MHISSIITCAILYLSNLKSAVGNPGNPHATSEVARDLSSKSKCQKLLDGKWTFTTSCGINSIGRWCGTNNELDDRKDYLKLDVDKDCLITGVFGRKSAIGGHNGDGKFTKQDEEDVIGYYDPSTKILHLVETQETGTATGTLDDDGILSVIKTQPGPFPVVAKYEFMKKD